MQGIEATLGTIVSGFKQLEKDLSADIKKNQGSYSKKDVEMINKALKEHDLQGKLKELSVDVDAFYKHVKNTVR